MAPLDVLLGWMRDGTTFFQTQLDGLPDEDLHGASLLPGWSRAHVVAHLARNADALVNLLNWADTGIETPMYADADQRAREIDESRRRAPEAMRADFAEANGRLEARATQLPDEAWTHEVRTAKGRIVPASVVPWLRTREVWIHAVDLDGGARLAELPTGLIDALIGEITSDLSANPACPNLEIMATDRDARWRLGAASPSSPAVRGKTDDLLSWLSGRSGPESLQAEGLGAAALALPPWL